jgi:hypothetical protein
MSPGQMNKDGGEEVMDLRKMNSKDRVVNGGIKYKWQLQNISSLRKVENKFRDLKLKIS